jgi:iron-sulfur cluster repair protein YtfE (RIC family)
MTVKPAAPSDIAALALAERNGWPAELRALIERYPRDTWQSHENLGGMAQFWLSRHAMFRELSASIAQGTAGFQEGQIAADEFSRWFAPRLQFFLEQLHAHHQIEDFHFFPIFRAADPRLARGFDVLEADHATLHENIDRSIETANGLIRAVGNAQAEKAAGDGFAQASGTLMKGLVRHLDDEEDLIVPLILDRGEDSLGVGHG